MYDLTTISLGAGLQSSAMCEMVVEGDLPKPDIVIFSDTGDEPEYVYQQADYLRGRLESVGVPMVTVNNGNMVDDIYNGRRFAALPLFTVTKKQIKGFGMETYETKKGKLRRQCTREYKIEPIEKHIREMLLDRGLATRRKNGIYINKGVTVETWLGLTTDEPQRMRPNRTKWITNRWPLIDLRMTRGDCTNWLRDRGLPIAEKSSCIRCPYHNDAYFLRMKEIYPDDWHKVVEFDKDLRSNKLRLATTAKGEVFLHSSCIPIGEVELRNQNQADMDFCDEGFCWT